MADPAVDVSQDPNVVTSNAVLSSAQEEQQFAAGQLREDIQGFNPMAEAGPQPTMTAVAPEDHMQDVMKVAPLWMALAAIGGRFGHQSGLTMITSTNAMMQGLVKGNADAYADARAKYDQQYQDFRDKQKTWIDTYKAYAAAYKGRVDADMLAVRGANAAVGLANAQVKNATTEAMGIQKLSSQIEVNNANIKNKNADTVKKGIEASVIKQKVAIAQQNADAKTAQVAQQIKTADANTLVAMMRSQREEIDSITKKYKKGEVPEDEQVKIKALQSQLEMTRDKLGVHTQTDYNKNKAVYDQARAAIAAAKAKGQDIRPEVVKRLVTAGLDPSLL